MIYIASCCNFPCAGLLYSNPLYNSLYADYIATYPKGQQINRCRYGYTALGHTPALANGARELRFFKKWKAQFVTVGII